MTWKQVPFRELGKWYGGGTPSKGNSGFWNGGEIPWLSPKDMGEPVLSGTRDHITPAAVAGSSVRWVPADSVAVVVRSGILERTLPVALVPFATTLNQDMKAVVAYAGVDPRWIAWGLRAQEARLLRTTRKAGTTVASIEMQRFYGSTLPVPTLAEQRRIVEILEDHLSRLDAAQSTLSVSWRRLQGLRESLIETAVTGRDRPIGAHLIPLADAMASDGDLPNLPEGWRWARLADVADVVGGVTKDANKQADPRFVKVPYLRVANVQRGHLRLEDVTSIRVAPEKADALQLLPGDVLLNEGGDRDKLARGWVWEGEIPRCIHQNHVFRARIRGSLDPYFLSWTANTVGGRWAERNGKQSVNLASISLTMIKKMPVVVPPGQESTAIAARLGSQLDALALLDRSIERARARGAALRRAVLSAAFEGKLTGRHTDAEVIEEMASV
ncbi:MAG: restriction endonuclease subunit S [Nocardioides sp.]